MIFSNNQHKDYCEIMALIDSFAENNDAEISVNQDLLFNIIKRIHVDFPCVNGAENASVFKKSSAFLCEFVGQQIVESFECKMSNELKSVPNNGSAIIGFYVVTTMLKGATAKDGQIIKNSIELSPHSYVDIIESITNITPFHGFRLVSVLLEQLVYKTNPDLQYENIAKIN